MATFTFWNPRDLLDVDPFKEGFSCTGTTKKGSRCGQKFIDSKVESSSILDSLSRKDVVTNGMDDSMKIELRILAENTLCPRWHRNGTRSQTEEVYKRWSRAIRNFIIEERATTREQIRSSTRQPEPARDPLAAPVPNEARPRQQRQNRRASQERAEALANIQRLLDELHRQIDEAEAARAVLARVPVPLSSHQERVVPQRPVHDNAAVENDSRPPRVQPVYLEAIADQAGDVEAPEAAQLPTPPQSPAQQERVPVNQHAQRNRDRAAVVQRKPLTNECYICYEPFEGPDDAVWCRRSCGQNIHKECFEEWSRGKERHEVNCGFCRADWLWE